MKILSKFFVMAFIASLFVSCGGDDKPLPTPVQKQISKTWTISIRGVAGATLTLEEIPITLADIPGVNTSNFISGEFQNSGSNIQITGLKNTDGAVLNNFTMQVNNAAAVNFGRVTYTPSGSSDFGSDVPQSSNRETTFLSSLFTAYAGKGKTANLKVTFTPSADIVAADNVNLVITINGTYNWNTFD